MALQLYDKLTHAMRYFLLRRLPTCKDVAPLMSESLERRLTLQERVLLKLHLWVCIWCVWYLEHLHMMRNAIRRRAAQVADDESSSAPTLSAEARERIKRALSRKNP